jgi:hypothetical protein
MTSRLDGGRERRVRVYVPLGMLGYGFPVASLDAALAKEPDVIAVDAGSTDPGPYYLGSGQSFTSRAMLKRDLGLLVTASTRLGIPLIVGSAGGAGGRPHLEWTVDVLREIGAEQRLACRVAVIDASLDKEYVKRKVMTGDVFDFEKGSDLTHADVDACQHLVAQMGAEPLRAALVDGADVVIAGRAYDAALMAVVPIEKGADPGLAYHMGKIAECGSIVALPRESDGIICDVYEDCFEVTPADPHKRCPVEMVAAHTLYEKSDPATLALPGGELYVGDASFDQVDERTVRVSGSRFAHSDSYFVKIEGAALAGHRAICVAGIRDPRLIAELDDVLARVREKITINVAEAGITEDYDVLFRVYGRDGVMGALEPEKVTAAHELGLVIDVLAARQTTANAVCALARSASLHMGYEGRIATGGNIAFPFSPAEFPAPPVYEFRAYHLMRIDHPTEPFTTEWLEL